MQTQTLTPVPNRIDLAAIAQEAGWSRLFFCPNYEVWQRDAAEVLVDYFSTGRIAAAWITAAGAENGTKVSAKHLRKALTAV